MFLHQLLSRMGYALFERYEDGEYRLLSAAPPWLTHLWKISPVENSVAHLTQNSPFLEHFLGEADVLLGTDANGTSQSETWVERDSAGREIPLQALALRVEGKRYLALQSPEARFKERGRLLQTARESMLGHEKLLREIQKKEILLHCIIHDLSQPLSVMSVSLDCLADEPVSDRAKVFLRLGKQAGDQQLSMIRDILHVFSADLKASLDEERGVAFATDLLQATRTVIAAYTPVFASKNVGLQLQTRPGESAGWRVRGEEMRLERVFSNLLENALRYAPSGSKVTISLEPDGKFLKAVVDDEGPGLPADVSGAQIFALFSKGKESGGKAGLGLYFCRLTVERWGGTIGCESRSQGGTQFWFRLPVAGSVAQAVTTDEEGKRVVTKKTPLARKGPLRILLADDQEDIRLLTAHQLERGGHRVVTVANGREALDALQLEKFDVIFLDEQMPEMTGIEALAIIRTQMRQEHIAVIALTGYNTPQDRERLLNAGFDGVIGKPFHMAALDAMLQGGETPGAPAVHQQAQPAAPAVAANDLLQRVGGDAKLLRQMTRTFLRDTSKRLTEIRKAIRLKRGDKLAYFAHALKGSVGIFGADSARRRCQQLQEFGRNLDFSAAPAVFSALQEEIAELEANLRGYAGQLGSRRSEVKSKRKRRASSVGRKSK